jgi:hypothetical protein
VTIHNSVFKSDGTGFGITGSSAGTTLGGVFYIDSANTVEVDNSTFQQISSVVSGGGLYVKSSVLVDVKNSVFSEIIVAVSGGLKPCLYLLCLYKSCDLIRRALFWCFGCIQYY